MPVGDSDKRLLTSLVFCLGEWTMRLPAHTLLATKNSSCLLNSIFKVCFTSSQTEFYVKKKIVCNWRLVTINKCRVRNPILEESGLGPLLFLICINDLTLYVSATTVLSADDTTFLILAITLWTHDPHSKPSHKSFKLVQVKWTYSIWNKDPEYFI